MKKLLLLLISTTLIFTMTACVGTSPADSTGGTNNNTQLATKSAVSNSQPIRAAYIDLYATGSFAEIRSEGFANSNMLIFGFAKIDQSVMPDDVKGRITTAMDSAPENAIGLLSVGGAVDVINDGQIQQVIDNVVSQINDYNNNHSRKIAGVDLDLENGISSDITSKLAKGFKQKNLIVAAAPQLNGLVANTDSTAPKASDLVLTSGGALANQNTYQAALTAKAIDYLLVQTYNTGWFQIDGHSEADEKFFISAARALSKLAGNANSG